MKNHFILHPEKMEDDFNNNVFTNFKTYPTSYNFTLSAVEDAIVFNNAHEAMHLGFMIALKKMV